GVFSVRALRMWGYAVLVWCTLACSLPSTAATQPDRQVAITIDDLPASTGSMSAAEIAEMTSHLLSALKQQKVAAVGFVNEVRLYRPGEVDKRIEALQMWLDMGFELGNHTFSHTSLNKAGLKVWEEDVIRGETLT